MMIISYYHMKNHVHIIETLKCCKYCRLLLHQSE